MKSIYFLYTLPFLAAAQTTPLLGTIGGPAGEGSETFAAFTTGNQNPNATGAVFLSGVDVSNTPFTLAGLKWRATLNVSEVIGTANTTSAERLTNSVISLEPPVDGYNRSSQWDTCVIVMLDVKRNATVAGQKDDGTCSQTFGKDCVTKLESAINSARMAATNRNGTGPCGGMAFPGIPAECGGKLGLENLRGDPGSPNFDLSLNLIPGAYAAANASNSSSIDSTTIVSLYMYYTDNIPHDASNSTPFEEAATRIWPIVLLMSPKSSFDGGAGAYSAQMSCLRATNVTAGSQKISAVPGAGSRVQASGWGLFAVVAGLGLLL